MLQRNPHHQRLGARTKTKKIPAGVSHGEREHLLPSEPDYDAGAVVDHR
jgi:hypothetical protein